MSRRRFRPLNLSTGAPVIEDGRRGPTRRRFRQLSGSQPEPPTPAPGEIIRTMQAASIADYAGLSDRTWSSGTTGTITSDTLSANWNCLYNFDTQSIYGTGRSWLMNPIRWSCDIPSASGGSYSWFHPRATATATKWLGGIWTQETLGLMPLGVMGVSDTFLESASHAEFTDSIGKVSQSPNVVIPVPTYYGYWPSFRESTLNALSTAAAAGSYIAPEYVRHRVNGAFVSDVTAVGGEATPGRLFEVDSISAGDTYEIDIWYRHTIPANLRWSLAKYLVYIPTTRTSNSSRRAVYHNNESGAEVMPAGGRFSTYQPVVRMQNVNFSTAFNSTLHTYNVTVAGHTGWTLHDGSDGPHKMIATDGWNVSIVPNQVWWTRNTPTGWCEQVRVFWGQERPYIELTMGTAYCSANSLLTPAKLYYTPSGSAYRTSVSSPDLGTINLIPAGNFNQSGSTTFDLVEWSQVRPFKVNYGPQEISDGRKTGVIPVIAEAPTTVTVTRTTQ